MTGDLTDEARALAEDEGRRGFLKCAAGIAGAAAAGSLGGEAYAAPPDRSGGSAPYDRRPPRRIPFHGKHQTGIIKPKEQQLHAMFLGLDVLARDRKELEELFKKITKRSRKIMGGVGKDKHKHFTEEDEVTPTEDLLTITLGVGASLFDDRFELSAHRPRHLKAMPSFPNDQLNPARCHGDLSLQICADHPDACNHVMRDLLREANGLFRPRWRTDAYLNPPRPVGTHPRTFVGFKDGIENPDITSEKMMDELMWVTEESGEPDWALGGCYQVMRMIRLDMETWDQVPVTKQEKIFGRHKSSGAPLDGDEETDKPNYRKDPHGRIIPLDAHIRLANPRTKETADSRIYRRSYNYDEGFDNDGKMAIGLMFCCYQQDIERQFATVQKRLEHEAFAPYIAPIGGGYFFVLPGVKDEDDYLGSTLMKAN
ncbi:Dyp-type peroxidase [Streptomyces halobius]|uniref:Dyp-type peroxidase n=1 Tax=Streptomyces halobius TaxID=2879846 RepID=A0ABY4LZK0_9ACTN|nr:Dyp-type peroxidase [Streptomyces halobius]UQA90927.1 Dyp-type peroxidase [Streptomyces halobius]